MSGENYGILESILDADCARCRDVEGNISIWVKTRNWRMVRWGADDRRGEILRNENRANRGIGEIEEGGMRYR